MKVNITSKKHILPALMLVSLLANTETASAYVSLVPPVGVPTKSVPEVLADATKFLLGFALMASVAVLVWGGINYITSSGSTEKADTAKKWIKYAFLGILVVGSSYALILAVDRVFH